MKTLLKRPYMLYAKVPNYDCGRRPAPVIRRLPSRLPIWREYERDY